MTVASFVEFQTTDEVKVTINVEQIVFFHATPRDAAVTEIAVALPAGERLLYVEASYASVREALQEAT